MPAPAEPARQAICDRLQAAGVCDAGGRVLALSPAPVVVGRVCDDQPLVISEAMIGKLAPERVIRGLAAAAVAAGADRALLAVAKDSPAWQPLAREAQGTSVELVSLLARGPMDRHSLLLDLAEALALPLAAAGLAQAPVFSAATLEAIATAIQGQFPLRRLITVAGHVRQPAVVEATFGASIADLVDACGGSPDPGWVAFADAVLGGAIAEREQVVGPTSTAVIVLPHGHGLVQEVSTPISDRLARMASACAGCEACSAGCTVHLNGGHLRPHLVLREASQPQHRCSSPATLAALECIGCGLCSARCPSRLQPSSLVQAIARELSSAGVSLAADVPLLPHPQRASRRLAVHRLVEQLGLADYESPLRFRPGQLIPERISLPLWSPAGGERVAAASLQQQVARGDIVALAGAQSREPDVRAPVAGTVIAIDPDDGIIIQPR